MTRLGSPHLLRAAVALVIVLALLLGFVPAAFADTQQAQNDGPSSMVIPLLLALVALGAILVLTRPRKKQP